MFIRSLIVSVALHFAFLEKSYAAVGRGLHKGFFWEEPHVWLWLNEGLAAWGREIEALAEHKLLLAYIRPNGYTWSTLGE